MATRNGSAEWQGGLEEGTGTVTIGNGVHTGPYSFHSRFEDGQGTNPEELLAAAEAACFSMQLGAYLAEAGHPAESISTQARCQLRNVDGTPTITQITLTTEARVPGIGEEEFQETAERAKAGCIVSRALAGVEELALTATLASA